MGTIRRLKDTQDKLKDAENAVPGAYENQYTGQVNDQLAAMSKANDTGFDFDTTSEAYRQYKANAAQNAQNGAAAATATAQGLAGGYGADWATSAAQQAAAEQTGAAGTSLADLRSRALQQWQSELAGTNNLVDTLLGQEGRERSTAGMNTGAAQTWRDYLAGRVSQARQENSDFWGNVWNGAMNVGNALLQGYDAYKGYEQQQWQNAFNQSQFDFEKQQYADSQNRTQLSDQIAAMEQAQAFKQAGFDELAQQTLAKYGLDSTMLDAWSGMSDVQKNQMSALVQGASLAASGNDTAADAYLKMAGLDAGSIDHYDTLSQKDLAAQVALQQALNKANLQYQTSLLGAKSQYSTSGGNSRSTSRSSGSSTGSSSSGNTGKSSFTNSQLQQMANKFSSMSKKDPLYSFYKQTLTDAGWLSADGSTNGTKSNAGTGSSAQRLSYGQNVVNTGLAQGKSQNAIMDQLFNQGFTDAEIAEFFNKAK